MKVFYTVFSMVVLWTSGYIIGSFDRETHVVCVQHKMKMPVVQPRNWDQDA